LPLESGEGCSVKGRPLPVFPTGQGMSKVAEECVVRNLCVTKIVVEDAVRSRQTCSCTKCGPTRNISRKLGQAQHIRCCQIAFNICRFLRQNCESVKIVSREIRCADIWQRSAWWNANSRISLPLYDLNRAAVQRARNFVDGQEGRESSSRK
jgi:hypothetical protein